jgi:ABC-type glutathione transport system ATPase component
MAAEKPSGVLRNTDAYVDVTEDPPKTQSTTATDDMDGVTKESGSSAHTVGKGRSYNEDDDDEEEVREMRRRSSVVQALAKSYSRASGITGVNPFFAEEDSPLNPNSGKFDGKAWAKSIVGLVQQDGGSFRSTGVCFQHLNVHGYGVATDYQKDVANVWLGLGSMAQQLVGSGRQKINILQNFDGLVRNGEMLVVLGPPGSGCSTFLKTIAGEMNGIYVDEGAYFNYQGEFMLLFARGRERQKTVIRCWGRIPRICLTTPRADRPMDETMKLTTRN